MAGFENDVMFALNADFTQADNQAPSQANGLVTNGQIWIGSTSLNAGSTHINVGSITSPDSSITIGYSSPNITIIANGSSVGRTLTGNNLVPISPTAGNWNIITANSTPKFVGAASTLTLDFGLTNLALGNSLSAVTSGDFNVSVGKLALQAVTSGIGNVGVGYNAAGALTSASNCVCIGLNAGTAITTSPSNIALGVGSLNVITTGTGFNTSVGYSALGSLGTGAYNTALGQSSGSSYTTTESSNICIGNNGTIGDSNVIRIGTQGSSSQMQNQCYIAGVVNTTSGRVVNITTPGAYPYTTLITDYVILVNTSAARTITLIASPVTGTTYRIKDNTGLSGTNNITVDGNSKNIDGASTFVISSNYDSIDIVYNGTQWNIL